MECELDDSFVKAKQAHFLKSHYSGDFCPLDSENDLQLCDYYSKLKRLLLFVTVFATLYVDFYLHLEMHFFPLAFESIAFLIHYLIKFIGDLFYFILLQCLWLVWNSLKKVAKCKLSMLQMFCLMESLLRY